MSALLIKSLNLGIIDSALSWIIGALTSLLMWLIEWTIDLVLLLLADILYELGLTLLNFVDFFQAFFNALCGMGTYWDSDGNKFVQQDPIISLVTNDAVLQVFLALVVVAVIMLFMTTLIAMVRTEFNSEGAKNTKGNILGQALKSLFMFFMVPAACIFGIIFSSALLNMVYTATSGGENVTAGGMVWYASSYNANRLRNNSITGLSIIDDIENSIGGDAEEEGFFAMYKAMKLLDDFGAQNTEDIEAVANAVDNAFKSGTTPVSNDWLAGIAKVDQIELGISDAMNGDTDFYNTRVEYSYKNLILTSVYYSTRNMNFIVMFLGGGIALYIMFIAAFGLIIRLYKCAILFMLSAPISALTPLDGGQTFKSWRKLMIGSVCSAFAVVIAFNLVFLLIPIMSEINIFNPRTAIFNSWNRLVNMLFVLTGLYTIKETSKWVAGMLGIEDPLAAGSEIAGKVMGTVGKMGAMAGGAIAAGVGKRMAAKAGAKTDAAEQGLSDAMDAAKAEAQPAAAAAARESVAKEKGYTVGPDGKVTKMVTTGKGKKKKQVSQEVTGDELAAFEADVGAQTDRNVAAAVENNANVRAARQTYEAASATQAKYRGFHSAASGVWQNTMQKTMGAKLQKFDDFMGGSKLLGGYDNEGNITGLGGLAFKGARGLTEAGLDRGARLFNHNRFDTREQDALEGQYAKVDGKFVRRKVRRDEKGEIMYADDGKTALYDAPEEVFADEKAMNKAKRKDKQLRKARDANIHRYQAGGSRGDDHLTVIHEQEAAARKMVEMTKQAADEVSRLIRTLTEGLKRMGNDAFKNGKNATGGLSDAAYQMYGQELARLAQLAGKSHDGKTMSVQQIAAGLIKGDNTAHNLQTNAQKNAAEMGKFYNNNINMGGIKVEMMGGNIKEALQEVFSGLNIEGASLEDQMSKVTSEMKKEIEKQNAELKKQQKMISQLAVAIAKYGKRLNPGK